MSNEKESEILYSDQEWLEKSTEKQLIMPEYVVEFHISYSLPFSLTRPHWLI